jgi:hypothetical protein
MARRARDSKLEQNEQKTGVPDKTNPAGGQGQSSKAKISIGYFSYEIEVFY